MDLPVLVTEVNGLFVAEVFGAPEIRAEGANREQAIAELKRVIRLRIGHGELVSVSVGSRGLHPIVGRFKDDPTIAELRDEIYRARDAEKQSLEIET